MLGDTFKILENLSKPIWSTSIFNSKEEDEIVYLLNKIPIFSSHSIKRIKDTTDVWVVSIKYLTYFNYTGICFEKPLKILLDDKLSGKVTLLYSQKLTEEDMNDLEITKIHLEEK